VQLRLKVVIITRRSVRDSRPCGGRTRGELMVVITDVSEQYCSRGWVLAHFGGDLVCGNSHPELS
jgi:hypothetical protein